jgi:hypothetical protein
LIGNEPRQRFQSAPGVLERLVEKEGENDNRHEKQCAADNDGPKKMGERYHAVFLSRGFSGSVTAIIRCRELFSTFPF